MERSNRPIGLTHAPGREERDTKRKPRDETLCAILNTVARSLARQLDDAAMGEIIRHCERSAEIIAREAKNCSGEALRNANAVTESFGNAARYLAEVRRIAGRGAQ